MFESVRGRESGGRERGGIEVVVVGERERRYSGREGRRKREEGGR
jgi:hypothetical protein